MPSAIRVVHETSARDDIMKAVGHLLEDVEPVGARVLVVVYEREKVEGDVRTKSGNLILPRGSTTSTLGQDKWQGRVGLVIALGPLAFKDDDTHKWGDVRPEVGDWVMFDVPNTSPFDLPGDRRARYVEDVHIEARLPDTAFDAIW